MTYQADETSVSESAPIELYEFSTPETTYYYTSWNKSYVYAGHTYNPTVITRTSPSAVTESDAGEMTIDVPYSLPMIATYAFKVPLRTLGVVVTSIQQRSSTALEIWRGIVDAITVEGRVAHLRSPSLTEDAMDTSIPTVYFQALCNHRFGDNRCGIDVTDFDFSTTITAASGRTVTVASVDGHEDQYYRAGEIILANNERRMITDQIGTALILSAAFQALSLPASVTLIAGCPRSVLACRDKFDNVVNFGGHPFIPSINLFAISLKGV